MAIAGKQILVVDDEYEVALGVAALLRQQGASVMRAASVDEAARYLSYFTFDLIFTDINMPLRSGYDLLYLIQDERIPTPIVAMSGAMDAYLSKQNGFAFKMEKPVDPEELVEVTEQLTEHSRLA
jgi:CheY-like chemotaxis protein